MYLIVLIHLYHIVFLSYRYIHIIMVFWSFLAGVVTFYCSLGPESLLPNILVSIKAKTTVSKAVAEQIWRTKSPKCVICAILYGSLLLFAYAWDPSAVWPQYLDSKAAAVVNLCCWLSPVDVPAGAVSTGPQLCRLWKNQVQKAQVSDLVVLWCNACWLTCAFVET